MTISDLFGRALIIPVIGTLLSVIVPCVIAPRINRSPGAKAFWWWLVAGGLANVLSFIAVFTIKNSHPILLVYRLVSVTLFSLIGYRLLSSRAQGLAVVRIMIVTLLAGAAVVLVGLESPRNLATFTDPAEQAAGLLLGVLLVAEAIRNSSESPFRHPGAWLGLGLVLSNGPNVALFPLMAGVADRAPQDAILFRRITSVINDVSLVIWCIPYWKRSVVWTR